MERPLKQLRDELARVLSDPSVDSLRSFLLDHVGELDAFDFKSAWSVDDSSTARHVTRVRPSFFVTGVRPSFFGSDLLDLACHGATTAN